MLNNNFCLFGKPISMELDITPMAKIMFWSKMIKKVNDVTIKIYRPAEKMDVEYLRAVRL